MRPSHEQAGLLRDLLAKDICHAMPCCADALSARLIEQAGFPFTFMSGFAVSATRLGLPDTGLISYGEMSGQGRDICAAVSIPVFGDGDTGYGNPVNVKRTVHGYRQAGFAAVMIEDQLAPKRCGHTEGKQVVARDEAFARIQAACDARDEGTDILILARTDARATLGLDEAIERARGFSDIGADILFVEAPRSVAEMKQICAEVPGIHMANLIDGGQTPVLPRDELFRIGYRIAAYPVALLTAAISGMQAALGALAGDDIPTAHPLAFGELTDLLGFPAYWAESDRYKTD